MTNSIDHIVKNYISDKAKFVIARISEEHCMCWSKRNIIEQKKDPMTYSKVLCSPTYFLLLD